MDLTIDTDEIRVIREKDKYKFLHRFNNEKVFITDGRIYETLKEALEMAVINMALSKRN